MVGGRVVAIREEDDHLCVTVADNPYGRHQFCCVNVAKTAHQIRLGDSLWWQCRSAYWTAENAARRTSVREDVLIPKIGNSYSPPEIMPTGIEFNPRFTLSGTSGEAK